MLIGWTGPAPWGGANAQSLPRDLSIDPKTSRLLQHFVPELQMLRQAEVKGATTAGIQPVEVLASFPGTCTGINCGLSVLGDDSTGEVMTITLDHTTGLVVVNATTLGNGNVRAGPIPAAMPGAVAWSVHVIVDRSIVELIVNNDTAFVVYVQPKTNTTQGKLSTFGQGSQLTSWKLNAANQN